MAEYTIKTVALISLGVNVEADSEAEAIVKFQKEFTIGDYLDLVQASPTDPMNALLIVGADERVEEEEVSNDGGDV